jgi:glycine betaine/proline transport system substrate-binding protein
MVFCLKKIIGIILMVSLLALTLVGCAGDDSAEEGHIVFADAGWDSIKLHNAVAGLIAEQLYGYTWEEVPGSSPVTHEGVLSQEIDVHMEEWTMNIPTYDQDLADGKMHQLSVNFSDNRQGFYVPRYVIEGDSERGIEAMAPDLKTVEDLKNYPDVFVDEEDSSMGRVYGAIPGWDADDLMFAKYEYYGLDENFIYFRPGSDPALSAALSNAYERGEAVVGYYWEPTWLMGKYDFVFLEEPEADLDTYKDGASEIPATDTTVIMSNEYYEDEANKDLIEFLSNYQTSSALISEALAHIQDTGDDYAQTAEWFLKENTNLLDEWLSEEEAQVIKDYLN